MLGAGEAATCIGTDGGIFVCIAARIEGPLAAVALASVALDRGAGSVTDVPRCRPSTSPPW